MRKNKHDSYYRPFVLRFKLLIECAKSNEVINVRVSEVINIRASEVMRQRDVPNIFIKQTVFATSTEDKTT